MRGRIIRDGDIWRGAYGSLGYKSARLATEEGRITSSASGEAHAEYDRPKLITQSRAFMRDNAIYKGMIERALSYIVGNGFTLQMTTKNKKYNDRIESLWKQRRRRPEKRQLLTGRKVERMICRELLTCGDHLIIKVKGGQIQLVEAEQLAGKRSTAPDGIEKDDYGEPRTYYVATYGKRGRLKINEAKPYKPINVMFITDPERPSATRGVPPCQASFSMLHRINDVCDSEAIAWQILSHLAITITREAGAQAGWDESKPDPNKTGTDTAGELATRLTELDYALIFHAKPGETVAGIERNIPGKNFSESLRTFLRLMGLPLGLPLELILLDWTKSNYSQSRAVLEQAFQTFLGWQFALEDEYYTPDLEWMIRYWISKGLVKERQDGANHEWIKPTFPWIDQLKEAQAYAAKIDRSFTTHAMVCKSLNVDRNDILEIRVSEIMDAIDRAKKIKESTGVDVPWQIFAGLEAPKAPPTMQDLSNKIDEQKKDPEDE